MTTIYILVKECFDFAPRKTYILDVSKDWNKINDIRKKLIKTIMDDGDRWFEEKIKHGYNFSELEVIEHSDFVYYVRAKNIAAPIGIEFRIVKKQLED